MSAQNLVERLANAVKANPPLLELADAIANAQDYYNLDEGWLSTLADRVRDAAVGLVAGERRIDGAHYCITHDDFRDERNNGLACRAWENDDVAGACNLVVMFIKEPTVGSCGLPIVSSIDVPPGVALIVQDGHVTKSLRLVD